MKYLKILFVIFLIFSLSMCKPKLDGYLESPFDNDSYIRIKIVTYKYPSQLKLAASKRGITDKVEGFAVWSLTGKTCEIHVLKLRGVRDYSGMETWGHELAHCKYGNYHKDGER